MGKKQTTQSGVSEFSSYFLGTETDEFSLLYDRKTRRNSDTTQTAKDGSSKSFLIEYKYFLQTVKNGVLYTIAVYDDEDDTIWGVMFSEIGKVFPLFIVKMNKDLLTKLTLDGEVEICNDKPIYVIRIGGETWDELERKELTDVGLG